MSLLSAQSGPSTTMVYSASLSMSPCMRVCGHTLDMSSTSVSRSFSFSLGAPEGPHATCTLEQIACRDDLFELKYSQFPTLQHDMTKYSYGNHLVNTVRQTSTKITPIYKFSALYTSHSFCIYKDTNIHKSSVL